VSTKITSTCRRAKYRTIYQTNRQLLAAGALKGYLRDISIKVHQQVMEVVALELEQEEQDFQCSITHIKAVWLKILLLVETE
jgi:hypothetical protein